MDKLKVLRVTIWSAIAALISYMVVNAPPGGVSWTAFYQEEASVWTKAVFLLKIYLMPAMIGFVAIACVQMQQRFGMEGAPLAACVGLGVAGWALLFQAFSNMTGGSRPGYILGVALSNALGAQVYVVRLKTWKFGLRYPAITWRWNKGEVEEINRHIATMRMQQRGQGVPQMASAGNLVK